VLHGKWGEGGVLQRLLEADGRPFVGCGSRAARSCMDKVLTKAVARELGLLCAPTAILDPGDDALPFDLPFVVKPTFEGSTIGLFICRTEKEWKHAHAASAATSKPCMVEPYIPGRELTQGLIPARPDGGPAQTHALSALPLIQITPAEGLYDYEAKYTRNDTRYLVGPPLATGVSETVASQTLALARTIGVRHLCRADFILDENNRAWFLELNTMPGFTDHSLVPMAAAAVGIPMPALCELLVEAARRDRR
jgi:D-alanine-D-alanine ligase